MIKGTTKNMSTPARLGTASTLANKVLGSFTDRLRFFRTFTPVFFSFSFMDLPVYDRRGASELPFQ